MRIVPATIAPCRKAVADIDWRLNVAMNIDIRDRKESI
jgi:hypothetical protein